MEAPAIPTHVWLQKILTAPLRPDRILMSKETWEWMLSIEDATNLEKWLERWAPFNSDRID